MTARIGVNAVFLDPNRIGGAETYTCQLIDELQKLHGDEHFIIFVSRNHELRITNNRFKFVTCNVNPQHRFRRIFWEQISLTRVLNQHKLDLVHFPYGTLPVGYPGPCVITMHDLTLYHSRNLIPKFERRYKSFITNSYAKPNRHIIFPSGSEADIIVDQFHVPRERIATIHHGVADELLQFEPNKDAQRNGILWIGRPYATKNVPTLLRAYALLRERNPSVPKLTLIGPTDSDRHAIEGQLIQLNLKEHVTIERPIPHSQIADRYRSAIIFCYPSTVESFGIPVLEAMACGTPVVCSDLPSFREICGDTVIFCDPQDPVMFADAMHKLICALTSAKGCPMPPALAPQDSLGDVALNRLSLVTAASSRVNIRTLTPS